MRKITDFIINKRHFILLLFIAITIVSAILSSKVKINYDMAEYLPDTSETRIGMDIMEEEFAGTESSTLNLMFQDLPDNEKLSIKDYLETIDGVKSVDYDNTKDYNRQNYTLYVITVDDKDDSQLASDVYNKITEKYKEYTIYTSGSVSKTNKPVLPVWIVILAIACALVILIIMCESYVEPFLFLTAILMAVLLNKGTNIIFGTVSNITNSISAILQLALSMDYSIMLMNRYSQEKETEKDNIKAMKNALYHAFQAISSSSVTTIVGLLALVFMSFKIGKDLGFVLAKGVLFSLICIFFVLPSLILMFDKAIEKTKKKSPNIKLTALGKCSYKIRYISVPLFLLVFIISFMLKGNLGIDYTDTQSDKVSEIFKENNQMAIIYNNDEEEKTSKYLKQLEKEDKIDEVLGYKNTIGEKLPFNKLNEKLNELGSDVNIEDYLLKIVYYDYFNQENNDKITFDEFIKFIEEEAYNNEKLNDEIDEETKNNITRLKNFITEDAINKKRTTQDIARILDIDKNKVDDILTYYLSKNSNIQISLNEFISFMNNEVLKNDKYAKKIDANTKANLRLLSKFTDKQTLQTKLTSAQMSQLFEIDRSTVEELYKYYISVNDIDIKVTISDFSNFVLNNVLTNSNYSNSFNEESIQNIKLLATFSDINTITKEMDSNSLGNLLDIEENKIKQILLLKYSKQDSGSKLSISEFINSTMSIKNNTHYLDGIDISKLESVSIFASNQNNINTTKMNKDGLNRIFSSFGNDFVEKIYLLAGLQDNDTLTPQEFVKLVLSKNEEISILNENAVNNLKLLEMIIDDTVSSNKIRYTATELAKILNMDINQMYQLYSLINYTTGNTNTWKATPNEFVKLILDNSNDENIKNNIDETTLNKLKLLSNIMTSSINKISYSYTELSQTIGIDSITIKNIYTLYISNNNSTKLTAQEFVNFILTHKDDKELANQIPLNTINNLNLINEIMKGIMANKKYTSTELSDLLGINKEDLKLIYGLYSFKSTKQTISLKEFINFILNDVITNKEYSSNFEKDQISKLKTVNGIMNNSLKNTKYTSDEIFAIISNLTDNVEKNTVEVLYTYYGSDKQYNDEWEMTVEEFVKFLNENILKDERFTDFIEDDMRNDIIDAKGKIADAKELIKGKKYSRIVLNTKFDAETKETFDFIQKVKDMLGEDIKDFYIIGDSPMAYEMSKTFDNELNLITVLTMIAIFIVVAITFKSIIIPIILVLTIQCAVYLTMGILAFTGENVYFIAILIVQSILMGATIDYAILYTSYYLENRKSKGIKEAIIASYNESINTILTSSSILIIVTLIIAKFASAITAKICKTISQGTLCSTILILALLPAVLSACDRFITKKK